MKRILIILLLLSPYLLAQPSHATDAWHIDKQDLKHAKNAHYWAKRDRWVDARQHANKAKNPLIGDVFAWLQYSTGSKYTTFSEVSAFIKRNPHWPKIQKIRYAMEMAITTKTPRIAIINHFTDHKDPKSQRRTLSTPVTATGKRLLAEALINAGRTTAIQNKTIISQLLRKAWVNGNYTKNQEIEFLDLHGKLLKQTNHHARIERLLWARKATDAARLIKYITSKDLKKLYNARIRLQKNLFGLDKAIRSIPAHHTKNEGLLYDRIKWRMKHGSTKGVISLLKQVPTTTQHAHLWWKIKKTYFDRLLKSNNAETAYLFAKNHGFTSNIYYYAEAEWKAGWIAYNKQNDPQKAYKHFYNMFQRVQTPISLGKAAYWAGRMASENQNDGVAQKWYHVASKYASSFYGQLATQKIGEPALRLPPPIILTSHDYNDYHHTDLLTTAYILSKIDRNKQGRQFIISAIKHANTLEQKALIATFGQQINQNDYGIVAAKKLTTGGNALDLTHNYPVIKNLTNTQKKPITSPEAALIHSITLQESMFDPMARSHAGARGMMQLMPRTAKEVAKRNKLSYNTSKLTNARYNITLGSHYLTSLLTQFNGSYVLAIAAYNGGPGNVRKWMRANGDPRTFKSLEEVLYWIENIPFSETQSYVQRVLENLQLYRYRLNQNSLAFVHTGKDLMR